MFENGTEGVSIRLSRTTLGGFVPSCRCHSVVRLVGVQGCESNWQESNEALNKLEQSFGIMDAVISSLEVSIPSLYSSRSCLLGGS